MSFPYCIFPEPVTEPSHCELRLMSTGIVLVAAPGAHETGRPGQIFQVPEDAHTGTGATLTITSATRDYNPTDGTLWLERPYCRFDVDAFAGRLKPPTVVVPPIPPVIPPTMPTDPWGIIQHVYATGLYDLSTHQGCGQFTEACALALYQHHFPLWGHIKKTPPQNLYNGHAVDAVQCLGGTDVGIWDIVFSSVSAQAKPAYNYKGPADPSLWMPPVGAPPALLGPVVLR